MPGDLVKVLSDKYNLPAPTVVIDPNISARGLYSAGQIWLKPDAGLQVEAHEFAHYMFDFYGASFPTGKAEEVAAQKFVGQELGWFTVNEGLFVGAMIGFGIGLLLLGCKRR